MTEESQEKKEDDIIAKTEAENKRLEEALKRKEELLRQHEQLSARDKLAGRSEAGLPQKTQQDLDNENYQAQADRITGTIYTKKRK